MDANAYKRMQTMPIPKGDRYRKETDTERRPRPPPERGYGGKPVFGDRKGLAL